MVIVSHPGNGSMHRNIKRELRDAGVDESQIRVMYGCLCGRDKHMGKLLKANEILHYGLRCAATLLSHFRTFFQISPLSDPGL